MFSDTLQFFIWISSLLTRYNLVTDYRTVNTKFKCCILVHICNFRYCRPFLGRNEVRILVEIVLVKFLILDNLISCGYRNQNS